MMPLGELSPLATGQLAAWEKIAADWSTFKVLDVDTGIYVERCASCFGGIWRATDQDKHEYQYTDAEKLALIVAHLRMSHQLLDPDLPTTDPAEPVPDPMPWPVQPAAEIVQTVKEIAPRPDMLTDKITMHGYWPHYLKIAAELGPSARVCEVGIDQGKSLRMWQALFPLGQIAGVDNSTAAVWPEGTTQILMDQNDPRLPMLIGPRELIVDDASHVGPVTRKTFDLLWPCVTPGGYYVIEDWWFYWNAPDNSMLSMARSLVDITGGLLAEGHEPEADEITYRWGMIVLRKRR